VLIFCWRGSLYFSGTAFGYVADSYSMMWFLYTYGLSISFKDQIGWVFLLHLFVSRKGSCVDVLFMKGIAGVVGCFQL
jgi:hypothetical protein